MIKTDWVINCLRGGREFPVKIGQDYLDSTMTMYKDGYEFHKSEYVNTDPTANYRGGILAEGEYYFICDRRQDNGKKVLFLFQTSIKRFNNIVVAQDLKTEERTFDSIVPNPNHHWKKIITNVLAHGTGKNYDGSRGCITDRYFNELAIKLLLGDKGRFILERDPKWTVPDMYKITHYD